MAFYFSAMLIITLRRKRPGRELAFFPSPNFSNREYIKALFTGGGLVENNEQNSSCNGRAFIQIEILNTGEMPPNQPTKRPSTFTF